MENIAKLAELYANGGAHTGSEIPPDHLWPPPDLSVLNQGRREAPPFPLSVFGTNWSAWLTAAAEGANSPVDYCASALLTSAAALIGNARWVSPWDGWQEPCVLWSGNVGDPSSNKTPGMKPVQEIIRHIENDMAADFDETHRRWQTDREAAKATAEGWKAAVKEAVKAGHPAPQMPASANEPPEPMRPRVVVNDCTPEKLGELAAGHEKGLMFLRDELAGWFGAFDRYSGNGAERALWLEAYQGGSHTIDRVKSEKPIHVRHLSIGVLGGIQPDKLVELLKGADDGLPSRFLWVWPEPVPPKRPSQTPDSRRATDALLLLSRLRLDDGDDRLRPRILPLTEDAKQVFHDWRGHHFAGSRELAGAVASAWGKAPGHLLRLALVLQHLWWCAEPARESPAEISVAAINSAAGLIEDYFKPMAARVYGDAALAERDRLSAVLSRWIAKHRPRSVNARKLRRETRLPGLKEADKVRLAIEALEDADWLRRLPSRQGETPGRQREDYIVNPKLEMATDA
jgi:hypothetical protein